MKTNFVWRILLIGLLLAGVTTVEAGKPVKNLDLYLCIGQSNMAGRGKLSPELMDTNYLASGRSGLPSTGRI